MADKTSPILTANVEHTCNVHSMGERLHTADCPACNYEKGARAQAQHTYKWGDKLCEDDEHSGWKLPRKRCDECWQLLLEKKESGR